jgi:DUF4097 and DUF4098 domain-containing protein YvlB
MKGRIFVAVLLVVVAAFAGRWVSMTGSSSDSLDSSNQDETRKTVRLEPGARVEVRGISGSVEIKTADTDTADVLVVRTAANAEDLERSKVFIEETSAGLVVRGEKRVRGRFLRWLWGGGGQVRQQVVMTVPRRVDLLTKGINGPVEVGEVEGSVEVVGVNGRVEVADSSGRSEIKGVNGNVRFGVSQLGPHGMEIKGVNGNVEVRLKQLANADIEVKGHNGRLFLDVPNVTMEEREKHHSARARLGTGGSPVEIKGINGNVRFSSAAPAGPSNVTSTAATTEVNTAPPPPPAPLAPPPPMLPHGH